MQKEVYEFISKQTGDPIVERRTCRRTGSQFPIFQGDKDMLRKQSPIVWWITYELPLPTLCPNAREQRRMMFKNERFLYKDTCEHTGMSTISRFTDRHVFSNEAWHKDDWDQKCLDYDASRPFNDTMKRLIDNTIYQNLIGSPQNILHNATYTNHSSKQSNTYLMFNARDDEYCGYGYFINHGKYIFDSRNISNSEYCYECVSGDKLFKCYYCTNCSNCNNLAFCAHMSNCQFCLFCTGLSNQSYCIHNTCVGKRAYEEYLKIHDRWDYHKLGEYLQDYENLLNQGIVPATINTNSDQVIGSECSNSHNCFYSFELQSCHDVRYSATCFESQDLMDITSFGESSCKMYEGSSVGKNSSDLCCCNMVGESHYVLYSMESKYCQNCFGCVNLYQKQYCIFNTQYTQDEYERIVPQIITHMQTTGERGEFFDPSLSPFPYNDSLAIDFYPPKYIIYSNGEKQVYCEHGIGTVTCKDDTEIAHATLDLWGKIIIPITRRKKHEDINIPGNILQLHADDIPNNIQDVEDTILDKAIICTISGRPFRILPIELDFYRVNSIPIPRIHPDLRYEKRLSQNMKKTLLLWVCDKCGKKMLNTYPIGHIWKIYCEQCYTKEIYW